jgi:chemotaxis protein CheD
MGDHRTGTKADDHITTYALGSCVGVTVYDSEAKVGGMLHAMLPTVSIHSQAAPSVPGKYVDTGLTALFRAVIALGGIKNRLEVKLAGGGEFLGSSRVFRIGNRNVAAVRAYLIRNGVKLLAADVGGSRPRNVRLHLDSGRVTIHSPENKVVNL